MSIVNDDVKKIVDAFPSSKDNENKDDQNQDDQLIVSCHPLLILEL